MHLDCFLLLLLDRLFGRNNIEKRIRQIRQPMRALRPVAEATKGLLVVFSARVHLARSAAVPVPLISRGHVAEVLAAWGETKMRRVALPDLLFGLV